VFLSQTLSGSETQGLTRTLDTDVLAVTSLKIMLRFAGSSPHSCKQLCAGKVVQVIDDQVHQIQYLKDTIIYR